MRNLSKVMAWLGLIIVVVGIGLVAKASLDIYGNMQPKNSVGPINPYPWIWVGMAGAVLGGFLAGLGIGLASKYKAAKPDADKAEARPAVQPVYADSEPMTDPDREPSVGPQPPDPD